MNANHGCGKKFALILCIAISMLGVVNAQGLYPCSQSLTVGRSVIQSSTSAGKAAGNAIDGITTSNNYSGTNFEIDPWWQIDLGGFYRIYGVEVLSRELDSLENYYIFVSDEPFQGGLEDQLHSNVHKFHVGAAYPAQYFYEFSQSTFGRYVRIQLVGPGVLNLREISIPGTNPEICNNGIDDDCDGKADCQDDDCLPKVTGARIINHPSSKVYSDGSIEVQAFAKDVSNLRLSKDGGLNFIQPTSYQHIFQGLGDGSYSIVAKDQSSGCISYWNNNPVILNSPSGDPQANCLNGDFESGSFQNWTGSIGARPNEPNITGIVNTRHTLLSSGHDEFIPLVLPFEGDYSVRLGNKFDGSETERLTYCFDVDNTNALFSFNYAVILQDPDHPSNQQPYFEYNIYSMVNDEKITVPNGKFRVVSDKNNPFFKFLGERDIVYKGWTCEKIDLTAYIGRQLCVDFTTADCSETGHFGYAYIDGLCSDGSSNNPISAFTLDKKYCQGQAIIADATGSKRFNQFEWQVCEINVSDQKVNCEALQIVDYSIPSFDVRQFYESRGHQFVCEKNYSVRLTTYNDCADPHSLEKKFKYICESNSVSYKDILICGSLMPEIDVQIEGETDCNSCTFEWQPSSFLQNPSSAYPTVRGSINVNAYANDYKVTMTNSQGCTYKEEVKTIELPPIEFILKTSINYCSYELIARVTYPSEVSSQQVSVVFKNNTTSQQFQGVLISPQGVGKIFDFAMPDKIDKLSEDTYMVTVEWNVSPNDYTIVEVGSGCSVSQFYDPPRDDLYFGPIVVDIGNVFSPNGDGINDSFGPVVPGPNFPANMHNAYWGKLSIYNRWGQKVWEKEKYAVPGDSPFDLEDIHWDGNFQNSGLPCPDEVYVFLFDFKNCDHRDGIQDLGSFLNCDCTLEEVAAGLCPSCIYKGDLTLVR